MRIGRATKRDRALVVVEDQFGALRPWSSLYPATSVTSALEALVRCRWGELPDPQDCEPLDETWRLGTPLRPARNMICVGTNYAAHAQEFAVFSGQAGTAAPELPVIFTKVPEALCGPTDDIVVDPDRSRCLDYEVELGVIIGRPGSHISAERALEYVAGYTVVNDITARDLQDVHKQWFLGKSLVAATPIGPVMVTPEELGVLEDVELRTAVDGEPRQRALVREMIFDVKSLIHTISEVFPLQCGDIISTGTPSGVGVSFDPPRYLSHRSEVVCSIEGIGSLVNRVVVVPRNADRQE